MLFGSKTKKNKQIPILTLRDVVVFPEQVKPLIVGRAPSVASLLKADSDDKSIVLVMQRDAEMSTPTAADLYDVGTLAKILQVLRLPDNKYRLLVRGEERVRLTEVSTKEIVWTSSIEKQEIPAEEKRDLELMIQVVHEQFERVSQLDSTIPEEMVQSIIKNFEASKLADSLIPHVCSRPEDQQNLLEMLSPLARLNRIAEILQEKAEVLVVDKRIRERVKEQMERNQKEYYLNEKMQAIQKELGDEDEEVSEFIVLKESIEKADMPEETEEVALRELSRLKKMNPMSAEATVSRSYIDWLIALPWNRYADENTDLNHAREVLEEEHYGLRDVKTRIIEYLSVRQVAPNGKSPILCLAGPPGIGKTSLARSIAKATNRPYVRQALGGVRDESEIRGHRRTYIGSMPGKLLQSLKRAKVNNPVFLLDEIDKMSKDFHRGDPSAALLEALDPEQNDTFRDHYINSDYDLSKVLFICTANDLREIPAPLQDRLEIIELSSYTEPEKIVIAQKHLIPKQLEQHALTEEDLDFSSGSISAIIRQYTREAGVRELERQIGKICRKVTVRKMEETEVKKVWLTAENLELLLGPFRYLDRGVNREGQIGVINGLAVTPWGGEVLEIEVATFVGKGDLLLTGRLGDWLKESARAGLSCIRMRVEELGLQADFHTKLDLHIHYPGNALKTDGPSAGVAMACAMISALTQRKIRSDVAITGEISLRGRVLAIGGVKEKMLAAHARGMKLAFLPKENEAKLEELPKYVREEMEIRAVSNIDEVLPYVFVSVEEQSEAEFMREDLGLISEPPTANILKPSLEENFENVEIK